MLTREQEQTLLKAAVDGDDRAFTKLVENESARTTAVAWRLTQDPVAAAEIAQEAFVRLHRALPTMRGSARVSTWLYRAVINLCHDRRRSLGREPTLISIEEARDVASHAESPEDVLASDERRRRVDAAVQALPVAMREPVILRYVRGMNYDEIAEVLDCPAGTVASRIHRALRLLGTMLAQLEMTEGSL